MARPDDLPEIEVVDGTHQIRSEGAVVSSGQGTGRRWMVAGALVVAALVGAALVSAGDDSPADRSAPSTTTSPAAGDPPSTMAPEAAGEYVGDAPAPVLGVPVGATLLLASADGWRHLHLDTGWVEPVPDLAGLDPGAVLAVPGGLLTQDAGRTPRSVQLPAPTPAPGTLVTSAEFAPAATDELARIAGVVPVGDAWGEVHVWVLSGLIRPDAPDLLATLVDLGGRRITEPFALPGFPAFGTSSGLVLDAGGRTFLAGPAGTTDLGPGDVHAASRNHIGRVVCDAGPACRQEIVDLSDGRVVPGASIPTEAAAAGAVTMAQADDGSVATLPTRIPTSGLAPIAGAPTTTLHVTRPDGRSMEIVVNNPLTAPAWLPGDGGLLVLTGLGLVHVTEADGELRSTRIPRLSPGDATALIVVPEQR